jgi:hypothetical protein
VVVEDMPLHVVFTAEFDKAGFTWKRAKVKHCKPFLFLNCAIDVMMSIVNFKLSVEISQLF